MSDVLAITTTRGMNMITNSLAGDEITFTRIGFGDGARPSRPTSLTRLTSERHSANIQSFTRSDKSVSIGTTFNNAAVAQEFILTEIGVYATSTAYPTEQLFAYINQDNLTETVLAESNNKMMENQFLINIVLDSAALVTATVESLTYVNKREFDDHVASSNPHGTTKADIGLGNVENVKTENATVTFTISETLTNISTGDTIKSAFSKIAKAISSLISHINNTNNPHDVTALQIGAAASTHYHNAADITAGTLAVDRGGTGKSSFAENGVLYANTSTAISQVANPTAESFLMQDASGAPQFKTKASVFASPAFTGTPTSTTAAKGTNTTQIATTAFVATGLADKANTASPTFTGTVTIPTLSVTSHATTAASTNYTTLKMRNIALVTDEPASTAGANGDLWFIYK